MGLKINTTIGTDQGITSEGYVRITNYNINKKNLDFRIELFISQDESNILSDVNNYRRVVPALNNEVGTMLSFRLTKEVITTNKVRKIIDDITGEYIDTEVDEDSVEIKADLSLLNDVSIFTYAYAKLKEKLELSFVIISLIANKKNKKLL
jgi:hypothetical protein